jgi:hypothetical protein
VPLSAHIDTPPNGQVNAWFTRKATAKDSQQHWYDVSDVGSKEGTALIDFGNNLQIREYVHEERKEGAQSTVDEENLVPCAGIPNSDFMLNITSFYPPAVASESKRQLGFNENGPILQKEFDEINNPVDGECGAPFDYVYRPYGENNGKSFKIDPSLFCIPPRIGRMHSFDGSPIHSSI